MSSRRIADGLVAACIALVSDGETSVAPAFWLADAPERVSTLDEMVPDPEIILTQSDAGLAPDGAMSDATGGESLATQLVDPTSSVTTLNFQDRWVSRFYDLGNWEQNTFVFQPVIPFKALGVNQILRTTLPFRIDGPYDSGLDPVALFDLFVFPASWGRWGFGPVMTFRPALARRDSIQAGPAVGFVTQQGKWTMGLFNQNLLSSDTSISFVQPILAYTINAQWTVSVGDLQEGYDWRADEWISLPIGFQVARLVQVGETTFRVGYNPQYNLVEIAGTPEWTHIFSVQLVVR